jgi:putative acetyltransferase
MFARIWFRASKGAWPASRGSAVGEVHTYRPKPGVFSHVLSELTIAVHPDYQGHGVGRALFSSLLADVESRHPEIHRVELVARQSHDRAIRAYASLGFRIEGNMVDRIRGLDGGFEATRSVQ